MLGMAGTERTEVGQRLAELVIGQSAAIEKIVPYIQIHESGLSPEGRPIAVFLLLGPTGTGKTRTVEAVADAIHGSSRKILKVDCAEFQMEHETAKLIGAPPGYLGHRETQPVLTQAKLNSCTSNFSDIAIVLFDEIEKAAPSVYRLLLGVLDKATLRLGDNSVVNFEKAMIFMTSNLGGGEMQAAAGKPYGLGGCTEQPSYKKLEAIGTHHARAKFSAEFMNRIDETLTYKMLSAEDLHRILAAEIQAIQSHINTRLGDRAFKVAVTQRACEALLKEGTSDKYGARHIKRVLQRQLLQPLARNLPNPGSLVTLCVTKSGLGFRTS